MLCLPVQLMAGDLQLTHLPDCSLKNLVSKRCPNTSVLGLKILKHIVKQFVFKQNTNAYII